ncbi:hypothetical protein GCM10009672_14580 [Nesterenkonia lutea]
MSVLFLLFGLAAVAVVVGFIVIALIQVLREPLLPPALRMCWVIVLIALPILGTLVWFVFGQSINERILSAI